MKTVHQRSKAFEDSEKILARLLHRLRSKPAYAVTDMGAARTMVTWGAGPLLLSEHDWRTRIRERSSDFRGGGYSGWTGWFSYDSAAEFEQSEPPKETHPTPPSIGLFRHEGGILLDHIRGEHQVTGNDDFRAEATHLMRDGPTPPIPTMDHSLETPATRAGAVNFRAMVNAALESIGKGDIYQVNLSWAVTDIPVRDPIASYLALRRENPAERSAFLKIGDWTILSNSPELFLSVEPREGHLFASSIPIKGTARDGSEASRTTLRDSAKETAELTMIVDLVRNDLGRVARPGSVHAGPRTLRSCGDLLHAEQVVSARLLPDKDSIHALAAAFPPGSVTGAPKVRAMQIIAELEASDRGIYTGSIGSFMDDGSAHWNVAIRTATIRNGKARFNIGAGIVAESDPQREWLETLAKGNMLYRGLCVR